MNCLLCSSPSQNHEISYWKCSRCELIFKDPSVFPDLVTEKARYETHNNDSGEPGYLKYLDRLFSLTGFESGSALDYGCGPSNGLAALVKSKDLEGVTVESYDPIFFKNADLNKKYDLIFASECLEHFYNPKNEIEKMLDLLAPKGMLAISTEFHDEKIISEWWYARDPTHVAFFGSKTMELLALNYGLEPTFLKSPHVILKK